MNKELNKERNLFQAFHKGNEEAFAKVYENYRDLIFKKILTVVKNPENAEEILQEAFLKIHRFRANYDPTRSFPAWAQMLAQNVAIDWMRANGRTIPQPQELIEEIRCKKPDAEKTLLKKEIQAIFRHATRPLSKLQKTVLWMRMSEHLSYAEIADKLDITLDAVKCAIYRAKRSLALIPEEFAHA